MNYRTEQEQFWAGEFGNNYIDRNQSDLVVSANTALFLKILGHTHSASSLIEFGSNIGMNLSAIRRVKPNMALAGVEINQHAVEALRSIGDITVHHSSILDFDIEKQYDISLVKGVLIHIDPESLSSVYQKLYDVSRRYVCVAEYYNPTPVEIDYRGHRNRLFKRDFAGELMDMYPDLELMEYGFVYHRDNNFPLDDVTWFLLRKTDTP